MTLKKKIVPCCVCDSTDHTLLYEDELGDKLPLVDYDFQPETRLTYRIVKCLHCGHIFTNPMPCLIGAYKDSIDEVYLATRVQRKKTAEVIMKHVLPLVSKGKWLDIGCSIGILLDEVLPYFETYGVEPSNWARRLCNTRHITFDAISQIPPIQYDVISLIGVIEHFENPSKVISVIGNNLAPNGIVILYTGNKDAIVPRILGKKWWWYQGMHLHFFSKATLSKLLSKHGLEPFLSMTIPIFFQASSLAKSINRYKIGRFISPLLNFKILQSYMIPVKISGEMLLFSHKKFNP